MLYSKGQRKLFLYFYMFFIKKLNIEVLKMNMVQFGSKLKELRRTRHISQDELGHIVGVSRATIGSWESGRRNISIKHLEMLCNYFKLDINYFRDETTKDEIIDLIERARLLFNNEQLPIEEKQKLSEELMRLYLQMKG